MTITQPSWVFGFGRAFLVEPESGPVLRIRNPQILANFPAKNIADFNVSWYG
jgi:hypothetical protein